MQINFQVLRNPLKNKFATNHRVISDNRQLLVKVTAGGLIGYGTGLLSYDDQELDLQIKKFEGRLPKYQEILTSAQLENFKKSIEQIKSVEPTAVLEHEAIDLALHDLWGKSFNKPLSELFGFSDVIRQPSGFSISAPLSIEEFDSQLSRVNLNLPILKLKMKSQTDLKVVEVLRNKYKGRIWIDGNCAWTASQLPEILDYFSFLGVEILEQPLPRGCFQSLARVKGRTKTLLFADEDCLNSDSISKISSFYDGVSIKLHKCGGLLEALKMVELAHRLNLKIMLGCRTENAIGVSAISQLASSADYLDLDGAVDILEDQFTGTRFVDGLLIKSSAAGIGVSINEL